MITIGIDLGSRTSKIIAYDIDKKEILGEFITHTGVNPKETSQYIYEKILEDLQIDQSQIKAIFSTGYGRNIVPFAQKKISEITCHAHGVLHFFPEAKTIIDIGGQDSKIIILNNKRVIDFGMNDKCAAGTGRFLEVAANILELTVSELAGHHFKSTKEINISSVCVVFAESEMIGKIAEGESSHDIIASVHRSISKRIRGMAARMTVNSPIIFTGGVAKNSGMRDSLEKEFNAKIQSPPNPTITGALGAAILAAQS